MRLPSDVQWRALLRVVAFGCSVLLAVACSRNELPENVDAQPSGERHYRGLGIDDRRDTIGLTPDLTIGGRATDSEHQFYRPIDVAVDRSGRIYVYDAGNYRIQVYAADGMFQRTIGRGQGQGPGGLDRSGRIAISGDELVYSGMTGRLSVWSLDGEFLGEHRHGYGLGLNPFRGAGDGSYVAAYNTRDPAGVRLQTVVKISADGQLLKAYVQRPAFQSLFVTRPGLMWNTLVARPRPAFAVDGNSNVYVTNGEDYEVVALSSSGRERWTLHVDWQRIEVAPEYKDSVIARLREQIPDAVADEIDWPERLPALVASTPSGRTVQPIEVDGHGHLYVFPLFPESWAPADKRPVDVYDTDGRLLFAGLIADLNWSAVSGDHVYVLQIDDETEEQVVTRLRLEEPWRSARR